MDNSGKLVKVLHFAAETKNKHRFEEPINVAMPYTVYVNKSDLAVLGWPTAIEITIVPFGGDI